MLVPLTRWPYPLFPWTAAALALWTLAACMTRGPSTQPDVEPGDASDAKPDATALQGSAPSSEVDVPGFKIGLVDVSSAPPDVSETQSDVTGPAEVDSGQAAPSCATAADCVAWTPAVPLGPCEGVVCDEASGKCVVASIAGGAACDQAGPPCATIADCHDWSMVVPIGACDGLVCDPSFGRCMVLPIADGAPCDDTEVCTTSDVCAQHVCIGGPGLACKSGVEGSCASAACEPLVGCVKHAAPRRGLSLRCRLHQVPAGRLV